nr:hypothetical protein [Vibrio fluvialis]
MAYGERLSKLLSDFTQSPAHRAIATLALVEGGLPVGLSGTGRGTHYRGPCGPLKRPTNSDSGRPQPSRI